MPNIYGPNFDDRNIYNKLFSLVTATTPKANLIIGRDFNHALDLYLDIHFDCFAPIDFQQLTSAIISSRPVVLNLFCASAPLYIIQVAYRPPLNIM